VVDIVHAAGGAVSFAHPAVTKRDELIPPLAEHGLDAIEVYHSDHTPEDEVHYRGLAARLGILISGGSDFHGDPTTQPTAGASPQPSASPGPGPRSRARRNSLGVVSLPAEAFSALEDRAAHRARTR
jgi:hypothetical protein